MKTWPGVSSFYNIIIYLHLVITIQRATKGLGGGRIYDKIHVCLYCEKRELKIGRHLQNQHRDEDDIKNLSKDKKLHSKQLDLLQFKGDFHHNTKVLKIGGEMLVWRRPGFAETVNYLDYVPCPDCLVFVTKSEMWRHAKTCVNKGGKINGQLMNSNLIFVFQYMLFGCLP